MKRGILKAARLALQKSISASGGTDRRLAGLHLDIGLDLLAAQLVGDRDDRALRAPSGCERSTPSTSAAEMFSPDAANDLLLAADEIEQAALVAPHDVARMVPATAIGLAPSPRAG